MVSNVGESDRRPRDATAACVSERTCVVTRAERAPDELIRFVADPAGHVVPDVGRRLPGRGVWVTCSREVVAKAVAKGAFARAFKRAVITDPGLPDLVETLLVRRVVAALSLANKAGAVVTGFAKVEAAIARGKVIALVHAAHASADGAAKLDRRLRAVMSEQTPAPVALRIVDVLSVAELSLAIGKPNVVHAALTKGGAADYLLREARRLELYRAPVGGVEAGHRSRSRSEEA